MKKIMETGGPYLFLFALEDLGPDTELRYNYGDGDFPWRDIHKVKCFPMIVDGISNVYFQYVHFNIMLHAAASRRTLQFYK